MVRLLVWQPNGGLGGGGGMAGHSSYMGHRFGTAIGGNIGKQTIFLNINIPVFETITQYAARVEWTVIYSIFIIYLQRISGGNASF